MTTTPTKEAPLCALCGCTTEAEIIDPDLGQLCYPCRDAAAAADQVINDSLKANTQPE